MNNQLISAALLSLSLTLVPAVASSAQETMVVVKPVLELAVGEPIVVNGIVRSRNDILLPAAVDGELLWVLEEGSLVEAGAVVAKVDDKLLLLQKEEQALLAKRAQINVSYLQREVDRLTQLQASNLTSQTQLAELTSRRDLAANDVIVARSRISQLDESLSRTEIVAPVRAMVVERRLQGGEFARRGEAVARVVNIDALEVRLTIPVTYLGRISDRQRVTIRINDLEFSAEVRALVHASDPGSQTITALADVPVEIAPLIASGQFAEVEVPLMQDRKSLFVPRDAVVLRSDGSYVYRIDENNVAQRVIVKLGAGQGDRVAVSGDLHVGDKVAVRGVERLVDGQSVTFTNS